MLAALAAFLSLPSAAGAQSWSRGRTEPTLWQIVAIDRSGETDWPWGREDVAADGLGTFADDEMATDLRSVYVDAQANALWLRAYVAAAAEPTSMQRAFFFVDSDARESTGGPARGPDLDEALAEDPTEGGYELAVAVRGDGDLLGVFQWDMAMRKWVERSDFPPADVRPERALADDPLEIGPASHGYFQLELAHRLSGLTQSCGGTIFVRVLSDRAAKRTFFDDAPEAVPCQSARDAYGDPEVLRAGGCRTNAECPADGVCREGLCVFAYACTRDADCQDGERCTDGRCVRVVTDSCGDDQDCDGLVCEAGGCAACSESGARACANGLVCSPNGACLDPGDFEPGSGGGTQVGKVRGGAFSCATGSSAVDRGAWLLPLAGALVMGFRERRRRRRTSDSARAELRQP